MEVEKLLEVWQITISLNIIKQIQKEIKRKTKLEIKQFIQKTYVLSIYVSFHVFLIFFVHHVSC